jgi:acyl-CoA synthetase (AMP-forming)/AMP-acid ligase II
MDILTAVLGNGTSGVAVSHGDRSWTWTAFNARIRAAAGLLDSLGVQAGDRVAFAGSPSPVFLEVALGCVWLGAVFVPVGARSTAQQAARLSHDSGARVLLGGSATVLAATRLADAPWRAFVDLDFDYERLLADAAEVPRTPVRGTDPFCHLYPGGSDGILVRHADLVADDTGPGGVTVPAGPVLNAAALARTMGALRHGATTVIELA